MKLSPKQEDSNRTLEQEEVCEPGVSFDTPNTVTIHDTIPREEITGINKVQSKQTHPSSSLSVLHNYHQYLESGNEPLEFHEYKTRFALELGERCIHGYLPIDGNIL